MTTIGVVSGGLPGEGAHPSADWAAWETGGRAPRSGDGNGFLTNFTVEMELLASLGITDVSITLEWARLEPSPGRRDGDAADRYHDVLRAAISSGLRPWVTLHSTSLPGWFADDERGYRDERARGLRWPRHVDWCAERFGDIAHAWNPIDDPIGWAIRGHLLGTRPPGRRDPASAADAIVGALDALRIAGDLLASGDQPVLASFGATTVHPAHPEAGEEARRWRRLLVGSWLGLLADGELRLPDRAVQRDERWIGAFDRIGLTYAHPLGVTPDGALVAWPADARRGDDGFAPNAEELGVVVRDVVDALGPRPLVVTLRGPATDDDDWRDELLRRALIEIEQARDDGIDIRGVFFDRGVDGYDWLAGFTTRRGVIDRDRRPRPSAARLSP